MTIGGFERRKGEQQQKRRHKLRPDEERQPHPGQSLGAQLNDGGDEIDRAEQRRRDQENEPDQPKRLTVKNRIDTRALVGDVRQRRVGCPAALGRAAGNEEADQHDDAADEKRPEAGHVDLRKSHVRRADLQRHDEIAEGGEGERHDAEEDHDRAVHRA